MTDNEKKPPSTPRKTPQWVLFIFPTILAVIGAYFALTQPPRPEAPVRTTPMGTVNKAP